MLRLRSLSLFIIALLILAGASARPAAQRARAQSSSSGDRLLASAMIGAPVAAGHFIFWKERHGSQAAIVGYELTTGTRFAVAQPADTAAALASDGAIVAWTAWDQAARTISIKGFDLGTRAALAIATLADAHGASEIAIDQGLLYYTDSSPAHRGLFAREIASGREQLISATGQRPVAADGALLWSEEQSAGAGRAALWSLHLRTRDGRHTDTVLAASAAPYAGFSGYAVSGGAVVWDFAGVGNDGVQLYRIDRGTRVTIALNGVNPIIQGRALIWTEQLDGTPNRWLVRAYDLASGRVATVVAPGAAAVAARALASDGTIALGVERGPAHGAAELHLSSARARGLRFDAAGAAASIQPSACDPALPSTCGQVRTQGAALADDGGPWTMRGVQFFLPQFGINGKSLWDDNYAAALADGSLSFWLDRAQGYLRANMLRVFVDLPSTISGSTTVVTPTSFSTLHSFAAEAGGRGMRLGLVLHNSASWTMTEERASWIAGLLDYFAERGSLPSIAYVSADNEINNHCGNAGQDCFDAGQGFDAQAYIDGAVGWMAQFRSLVKSRTPQVLVTVGISSETIDADLTRAAFDFFRSDSQGRTLAGLADFLAPHNYSGGAAPVMSDLRIGAAYGGAVVLEEFGFPTDPRPRDPSWTEGPLHCWANPLGADCAASAPFFVETNLRAQRAGGYAGGSAWMLADMHEKDTASACTDPQKQFALWTGLFAIGGTYCEGGTASRGVGQPKATALRVCVAYAGSFAACTAGTPFQERRYLPAIVRP